MFTVPTFAPVRNAELWQEFIKFIVRTQFHAKYPDVRAKLRPVVDTIFAQSYQEFQTELGASCLVEVAQGARKFGVGGGPHGQAHEPGEEREV
eukprot:1549027-Pyramimonas_sp.AAC.1